MLRVRSVSFTNVTCRHCPSVISIVGPGIEAVLGVKPYPYEFLPTFSA
jgi:hypothetical protein